MKNRKELLQNVLEYNSHFKLSAETLKSLNWDYNDEPAFLEKKHLKNILSHYLRGHLTTHNVQEWAEFLEVREDVDYRLQDEKLLSEFIHVLANPELEGNLTPEQAKSMISKL